MYRIIDSRSSGKTSRLMLLAKETNSAIACYNPPAMRQKAYAYGITGIEFIPYSDLFKLLGNLVRPLPSGVATTQAGVRALCADGI